MLKIPSLPPTPQAGVPPRVDSLRLFMQSARSYPPYMDASSLSVI